MSSLPFLKPFRIGLLAGLYGFVSLWGSALPQEESPNVLFISIDDLKPLMGCYGIDAIQTPHMDRLADQGTLFTRNYCQQAVCGLSRASLLTGLYPDENTTWGFTRIRKPLPEILTLPEHLRHQGYTTVNISKIFDYRTVDEQWDNRSWTRAFPLTEQNLHPYYPKSTGPESLKPLLRPDAPSFPRYAISQYTRGDRMGYAVRDADYRYVAWYDTGWHVNETATLDRPVDRQLFDYRLDPHERINRIDDPSYQESVQRLHRHLEEHLNRLQTRRPTLYQQFNSLL